MLDPNRVKAAAGRFRAFFEELGDTFLERNDVLKQVALALLSREHALLTGPPGTAKSALATGVFGRILCAESGTPSVYSRQITESTVQTDLIGPIDFKNLMETGRTTHFTDEGMLGAAHAFLDEVFDGRDMLLRSALNVLQERELKQGTKVTEGQIEVALMTTNRYIADVIERARQTLLAFIDRIAFVSFVPRGFANPANMQRVLERHVARAGGPRLDALLTLQDLDVLQALVEEVHISKPICTALAQLLESLDKELSAAVRADPDFVPTRYLSTRTAVRSGGVLRAICVYRRIFGDADREMQVLPSDLSFLRLHLLLSGPNAAQVDALLGHESDPSERRQLEILRTEREIFDRCLAKLPKIKVKRLVKKTPKPTPAADKDKKKKKKSRREATKKAPAEPPKPPPSPLARFEAEVATDDVDRLMKAIAELTALTRGASEQDAARARELLQQGVAKINEVAFRAALDATGRPSEQLVDTVERLVTLASSVEDDTVSMHGVATWLRERATAMINETARYAAGASTYDLLAAAEGDTREASARTADRLDVLDKLARLRSLAQSAATPAEPRDEHWLHALDAAEDDLAALWDATFCRAAKPLLTDKPNAPLPEVLAAIEPELVWLEDLDRRLATIRGGASSLKAKAIGARLTDLVAGLMRRVQAVDRATLHEEIEGVLTLLKQAKLAGTIAPSEWISWATEALVRAARQPKAAPGGPHDFDGYQDLRSAEQRVPVAYTLSEVALRVAPEVCGAGREPSVTMEAIANMLGELPAPLRERAAKVDLDRIERSTEYLEQWWGELSAASMPPTERLDRVVRSRFFDVVWDDSALARFALETRLIADVIPDQAQHASALQARLDALQSNTRRGAHALLRARTDEAWLAALRADG